MSDILPQGKPDRLESWKEIATYLRRDVSTVQRWEKREGLPVHRHIHDKLGSVYAHKGELDAWRTLRRSDNSEGGETVTNGEAAPVAAAIPPVTPAGMAAWQLPGTVASAVASRHAHAPRFQLIQWLLSATFLAGTTAFGAAWLLWGGQAPQRPPIRFMVMPPPGTAMDVGAGQTGFAVSPDGKFVVFLAKENSGPALAVRALDSVAATVLRGTEGGYAPFWSPDSRMIGFYTEGHLKKIALAGGVPETICEAATTTNSHGASWSKDNLIVFASGVRHLLQVPAAGGVPTPATAVDPGRGEDAHHYPAFLPDGRYFLYAATSADPVTGLDRSTVRLASLDGTAPADLIADALRAEYVESGFVLFGRRGVLLAQRFDPDALRLGKEMRTVVRGMRVQPAQALATFSASDSGVIAYAEAAPFNQLVWVRRDGRDDENVTEAGVFTTPRLSRDQTRLAVEQHAETGEGQTGDLWVHDLVRRIPTRVVISTPTAHVSRPVWSPDDTRLAVANGGRLVVHHLRGDVEDVLWAGREPRPSDWSADGRFLIFDDLGPTGDPDIYVMPMQGPREPLPLVATPFVERRARLSPDGRWVAFESNQSGRHEVYVRPFPGGPGQWQVSSDGGTTVRWRGDGRELYYLAPGGRLMAVAVGPGRDFASGKPAPSFDVRLEPERGEFWYEVSRDGQRALISRVLRNISPLVLVSDWLTASERTPTTKP